MDADACFRALASRDRRFEGRFFVGVTSTGVYCRPGCPAPLPKREHVRFFPCAAAAEAAQFRPCLRCRPETAPGQPAWAGTEATVARALRLIQDGALDGDCKLGELAERLGVGERHLRRLFRLHLGASPQAIVRTRRLHFARRLLDETRLPMTEVALAAGFPSVRGFNRVIRDVFRKTPREIRRARGASAAAEVLTLRLPAHEPFAWEPLVRFLGARAIPGVEVVSPAWYRRTLTLGGAAGSIEVRPRDRGSIELEIRVLAAVDLVRVAERVTRMFDLDADPADIGAHLGSDPKLAPLIAARPGLRVPGCWDGFELAVRAVLGQQISVARASALSGKLVAAFGQRLPDGADGLTHLFPKPEVLAGADVAAIGMPRARAGAICALGAAVADGRLIFDRARPVAETLATLESLPGIGPWTAQYIALRALGEPDAFPAGDLGLAHAAGALGIASLATRAEAWRPFRAYAAMHLWETLS